VLLLKRRGTSQAGSQFFTTLFWNHYRHKFIKAALLFRNLVEEGHIPEMGRDTFSLQAVL
jgi:tRNA splicing endonuclease